MLKYLIVGMGVQGNKRKQYIKKSNFLSVDITNNADFKNIEDVPLDKYNAVIICVPDKQKLSIIKISIFPSNKCSIADLGDPIVEIPCLLKLVFKTIGILDNL